jgi:nicotinamidase-related amidase
MTTGLVVIDMQVGLFEGEPPCHDAVGVVERINTLARAVREKGGSVFLIQHENDTSYAPGARLWQLLPALDHQSGDVYVGKTACDCFYQSNLEESLHARGIDRLLVTGCATELCVDTTIRVAASKDYEVVVVGDGHTTKNRPVLKAEEIIAHHNWVWSILLIPGRSIKVVATAELLLNL